MKKILLFIVLLLGLPALAVSNTRSTPLKSRVDERFELTSIIFRMGGAKEYSQCSVPSYAKDIDSTFAPYKDHKVISYFQQIRDKYGISYGDGVNAASCMEIKNGAVIIKPKIDLIQATEKGRWTSETLKTFIEYLNDFYQQTNFRDFYNRHADLYATATKRLDERLVTIDIGWFESIFGNKLNSPVIIASLTNGPSNYSFYTPDKNKKLGIVVGGASDNSGMPLYNPEFITIILHEFIHGFSNPLMDQYRTQIDSAAQIIYPHVREAMYKIGYGDAYTVMTEWFCNLMVCVYFIQHPDTQKYLRLPIERLTASYQQSGYIWMERSITFIQRFLDNRDRYPKMKDFMPRLIEFINDTAEHIDQVSNESKNKIPYIVETFPQSGSTITTDTDTIFVRFSEPMLGDSGVSPIKDENTLPLPVVKRLWKDDYTFMLVLDKNKLQKGKTYGVMFGFFQSKKRYVMDGGGFSYTYLLNVE